MRVYTWEALIFFLTLYLLMQLIQLGKMYIIPKDTTEQNKQKKAYCVPFIHKLVFSLFRE